MLAAGYTISRYVKFSVVSSNHRHPCAPPGRSRRQEGVLLQGHPRPWPVAKLRTFGDPRPKSARRVCCPWRARVFPRFQPYSQCGHPAASRSSAAGSLRHQKPCVRQSQPHRFCCLRSSVSLRLVQPGRYSSATLPGRARQRCFGRPGGGRSGRWRRHCRFVRWPNRQRLRRWGSVCAGPSAISVYPSNQPCHGPFRPGPRRPSAFSLFWRSLPAAGSLGSPVRGPVKARQRLTLPDRLRGHPPLPLVAPGPWWFRDSKPGSRIWVGGEWQRWWPD